MRNILLTLAAALIVVGTGARAQSQTLEGYICQPATCFVIAEGTSFTSGIIITGNWFFKNKDYYKTAITALTAINCNAGATIESVAYSTSNPQLGTGVLADSTGSEANMTLIQQQQVCYFFGGCSGFVTPTKSVPCL